MIDLRCDSIISRTRCHSYPLEATVEYRSQHQDIFVDEILQSSTAEPNCDGGRMTSLSALHVSDIMANQPVVVDNGTGVLKAGFAGADKPKVGYKIMIMYLLLCELCPHYMMRLFIRSAVRLGI